MFFKNASADKVCVLTLYVSHSVQLKKISNSNEHMPHSQLLNNTTHNEWHELNAQSNLIKGHELLNNHHISKLQVSAKIHIYTCTFTFSTKL